ncbi:MAG: helix-turn-helix domain-containing protein [Chloroflexota bacterium]|nr:helix-turn-helix domain-containing protein [Chloroflexota bacterium]
MASAQPNPERQQRIFDAAAELIAHYGFDKTTMDEIAKAAGVSKGALYLHFKSKDDLFEALLLQEAERVSDTLMDRVTADPQGGSIISIFTQGLLAIAENRLLRALYTRDQRVLGDYFRKLARTSSYQQGFDFGLAFVEQMQAAGLLRSDIPSNVITYILAVIRYGLLTIDSAVPMNNPPPLEQVAPIIGDMLRLTLVPEGGDSEAGKQAFKQLIEFGRRVIEDRRSNMKAKEP